MKDSPGSNGSPGHKGEKVKKVYKRTKKTLQSNKYTQPCCPPTGEVATTLTLVLTIIAIFFSARTVLGPIAGMYTAPGQKIEKTPGKKTREIK